MIVSRTFDLNRLEELYNQLTPAQKRFVKIKRNDSVKAKKNKYLNALVNSGEHELERGERLSYNYDDQPTGGKGRPRTTKSERQRVCRPVYRKNEAGKFVEEQSKECRDKGRKEGVVGEKVSNVRIISNRTNVETLRKLARKNGIRGTINRMNKQTLIDKLKDKGVVNYTVKDLS